ncbi:hypothetical protein OUZ56_004144 [Daphnia magna]|uniref:Uncharacterized protein n=1 Tax=Daphnia magna TaxID=35525 RepID=A0ABQ9YNW5_9CRUS|nr:hypothetical protein OUZ56_004144 [Daphnia magna]
MEAGAVVVESARQQQQQQQQKRENYTVAEGLRVKEEEEKEWDPEGEMARLGAVPFSCAMKTEAPLPSRVHPSFAAKKMQSSTVFISFVMVAACCLLAEAAPQDLGSPIRIAQCRALCLNKSWLYATIDPQKQTKTIQQDTVEGEGVLELHKAPSAGKEPGGEHKETCGEEMSWLLTYGGAILFP